MGGGGVGLGGLRVDVNEELKFLLKFKKKKFFFFFGGGGGGGGLGWGGGQGGCESRIEVFGKFKNKNWGGGPGWGVRMDVNEELKFL